MIDTIQKMQDGWRVETRIRTCGKQSGAPYKVYKHPESGLAFWSLSAAIKGGFTGHESGEVADARRRRKGNKAPPKAAKPPSDEGK